MFHWFVCLVFIPEPCCCDYCSFVKMFWNQELGASGIVFFLKIILLFGILWASIWISEVVFPFLRKYHWDFDRNWTESLEFLGQHGPLNSTHSAAVDDCGIFVPLASCSQCVVIFSVLVFLPPSVSLSIRILFLMLIWRIFCLNFLFKLIIVSSSCNFTKFIYSNSLCVCVCVCDLYGFLWAEIILFLLSYLDAADFTYLNVLTRIARNPVLKTNDECRRPLPCVWS